MKRISLSLIALVTVIAFSYCSGTKKAAAPAEPAKLSYQANVHSLIVGTCSPCHIPTKGGNKLALDTYESSKANIDDIIRRIELHPGDRGFMPFKRPRLSDSAIAVFKQWKADGLMK